MWTTPLHPYLPRHYLFYRCNFKYWPGNPSSFFSYSPVIWIVNGVNRFGGRESEWSGWWIIVCIWSPSIVFCYWTGRSSPPVSDEVVADIVFPIPTDTHTISVRHAETLYWWLRKTERRRYQSRETYFITVRSLLLALRTFSCQSSLGAGQTITYRVKARFSCLPLLDHPIEQPPLRRSSQQVSGFITYYGSYELQMNYYENHDACSAQLKNHPGGTFETVLRSTMCCIMFRPSQTDHNRTSAAEWWHFSFQPQ